MHNKMISVIVPVYNMEKYLARCIDSILAQSYGNIEIILVDDGSKDSSPQICDQYAQRDSRVKVIHQTNGGLSSARNAGLAVFVELSRLLNPGKHQIVLEGTGEKTTRLIPDSLISIHSA